MANSTIPELDTPHRNRNPIMWDRVGLQRRWAFVPEMTWQTTVDYADVRDNATFTQVSTATVGATVNYAVYALNVSGTGTDGEAVDIDYEFQATPADADADVAAALAALIDADTGSSNPLEFLIASAVDTAEAIAITGVEGALFTVTPTITYNVVRTATVDSTVPDGVYEIIFATSPPTTATFTASSDDDDAVAAGLEAQIEDRRDGTISTQLDGVVLAETVSTAVVTIAFEPGEEVDTAATFPATGEIVIADATADDSDLTVTSSYSGVLDVNATWPNAAFPGPVMRGTTEVQVVTGWDAETATVATLDVGDADDPTGLIVTQDILAAGDFEDTDATEVVERIESTFAPLLTFVADTAPSAWTQGEVVVRIDISPLVSAG